MPRTKADSRMNTPFFISHCRCLAISILFKTNNGRRHSCSCIVTKKFFYFSLFLVDNSATMFKISHLVSTSRVYFQNVHFRPPLRRKVPITTSCIVHFNVNCSALSPYIMKIIKIKNIRSSTSLLWVSQIYRN